MKRIQRLRTRGWRMPEGAVYVGRPSLWGNPWEIRDATPLWGVMNPSERAAWCVRQYREELEHWGLMSDWDYFVSEATWQREKDRRVASGARNMREYAPIALRDATALVCWCPLVDSEGRPVPCHADVLIELLRSVPS